MEHQPIQAPFEKPGQDYLRVATASPEVAIGDVPANIEAILASYADAQVEQAELVVLPELGVTGYSTSDLLQNQHVLSQARTGLEVLAKATVGGPAMIVGAPLMHKDILYNCGVVLAEGKIVGAVPKSYLPNYKEFYEARWFTSGKDVIDQTITIGDQHVPFGVDVLFDLNDTKVGIEICEDVFAPLPPSTHAALGGAEVIVNLSASDELVGKVEYRKQLVASTAARLICAYVYASAGRGESVADVIYGGHQMINENGRMLAEHKPHDTQNQPLVHDIDRTYLQHDRITNKTFAEQARDSQTEYQYRTVKINIPRSNSQELLRKVDPLPFVPRNPETLDARCEEIFNNLSTALSQRVRDAKAESLVLGLSGGLDSTLALLIALQACDKNKLPYNFVHTITMPGQASSDRTQDNASQLAQAIGTTHQEIPIAELAKSVLSNIGHDGITEDITFENVQARMRTLLLMNYSNSVNGFVEGTGDMSENAIGWCTYNGDHMSMYNPNGGVPKTLVSHLVKWYAKQQASPKVRKLLEDILATPISPELTGDGDLSQSTEDIVGPYELTDFFMYEHLRYGSEPQKIGYLALQAFDEYTEDEIAKWLNKFFIRHTNSQWKRDVAPNSTKAGSVAESPRGDLRMAPNISPNWYK